MKLKWVFWAVLAFLIVLMLLKAFDQPGVKDLSSGFEEVTVYRNENNTGPVIRWYVVTTNDPDNTEEMKTFGRLMPYTKFGETKVFFFDSQQPFPEAIQYDAPHFPKHLQPYCLAVYEKSFQGERLVQKPYQPGLN